MLILVVFVILIISMSLILLVEDDPEITNLLDLHFDSGLYQLTCCSTGKEAIEKTCSEKYDLIIMDITLPDSNGMELCKRLRQQAIKTPIIMLSCHSDEADKILALELGADDYITKPFGVLELMARIKAVLRRSNQNPRKEEEKKVIIYKELIIDSNKIKATINGQRLDLTPKEFDLLLLLARNPEKTFSRHDLLEQIWGYAFEGYEHTITSHINRLRIKIESDLNHPKYILTSWGKGYRFSE